MVDGDGRWPTTHALLVYLPAAFNAYTPTWMSCWFIYQHKWLNTCKDNRVIHLGRAVSMQCTTQIKLMWTSTSPAGKHGQQWPASYNTNTISASQDIFGLFGLFFQPEQCFSLTTIQAEQCFQPVSAKIQTSERGHYNNLQAAIHTLQDKIYKAKPIHFL